MLASCQVTFSDQELTVHKATEVDACQHLTPQLQRHRRQTTAQCCSCCAAWYAGQGEDFQSVEQVVQCMRPGVLLNAASVPSVRTTDRHGRTVPLNRYILDFWSHGQKRQLMEANGMREGETITGTVMLE